MALEISIYRPPPSVAGAKTANWRGGLIWARVLGTIGPLTLAGPVLDLTDAGRAGKLEGDKLRGGHVNSIYHK